MSTAAMLLGLAALAGAGPSLVRVRAGLRPRGRRISRRAVPDTDPLAVAASLDVLTLCLVAGMTVPAAAAATAASAPPRLARTLRRGAQLLALGADPATAWSAPPDAGPGPDPQTAALLRLARRSGSSGAALADAVAELADQCRQDAAQAATAAAERAGVLIAGPLGVCFLPAFGCLGIAPVVAGLAGDVLGSGLL
jgi:pilus assembly protein TadC